MYSLRTIPQSLRLGTVFLRRGAQSQRATRPFSQLNTEPRHLRSQRKSPIYTSIRQNSSSSSSSSSGNGNKPLTDAQSNPTTDAERAEQNRLRREQEPAYQLMFTCKPCGERSSHRISKQGYHSGTVLIKCPSCSNRHIISDHLGIFLEQKSTLEDLLKQKGVAVTKGYMDGDFEFRDDGTVWKLDGHQG